MSTALIFLNIATALLGIASAFCWTRSSTITVKHSELSDKPDGSYRDSTIVADGNDFLATAKAQSRWNKRAATLAAFTALSQAAVAGISAMPIQ